MVTNMINGTELTELLLGLWQLMWVKICPNSFWSACCSLMSSVWRLICDVYMSARCYTAAPDWSVGPLALYSAQCSRSSFEGGDTRVLSSHSLLVCSSWWNLSRLLFQLSTQGVDSPWPVCNTWRMCVFCLSLSTLCHCAGGWCGVRLLHCACVCEGVWGCLTPQSSAAECRRGHLLSLGVHCFQSIRRTEAVARVNK